MPSFRIHTFFRAVDLRKLDVPLLGVVSAVLDNGQRHAMRADRLYFLAASGSLVVAFAIGLTVMSLLASR